MIIRIHQLHLRTIVGAHAWEQESPRLISVNLEVEYDARKAIETEQVEHTVNYHSLSQSIIHATEKRSYKLIETLADDILRVIMENSLVQHVQVEVFKPGALQTAESVSVVAHSSRK